MSITPILTKDIALLELTDLFCKNQKSFYSYIASDAASDGYENGNDIKPLRFHIIENMITCIFSSNMHFNFYNAILDTDICNALKQYPHEDDDRIIRQILSLASQYKCPMCLQVKPAAIDTQKLLKRYGFCEIPVGNDAFQYIDFYQIDYMLQHGKVNSDIKIYELDDSTQADCSMRKSEWGHVLCASFGFINPKIYGLFYSNVWSRVEVGPTKSIRMFIAIKNDRVVGGCHVSLASGIACLFNVTTLKNERRKGIGKALSIKAMISAKNLGHRYMVLAASDMGLPIYKKLGFKRIPPYKMFIKLSTAAWYYKIIELILVMFDIQRLNQLLDIIRKPSNSLLWITMIVTIGIGLFIVTMFR